MVCSDEKPGKRERTLFYHVMYRRPNRKVERERERGRMET